MHTEVFDPEEVARHEERQKMKARLQKAIIERYLKEYPASNINEWIETYSEKFNDIIVRNHHYLPDFNDSMDQHPENQDALLQKVELELYK